MLEPPRIGPFVDQSERRKIQNRLFVGRRHHPPAPKMNPKRRHQA